MAETTSNDKTEPNDRTDAPGPDVLDPAESDLLRDELKGRTLEHASPPRLEDEGQPGG